MKLRTLCASAAAQWLTAAANNQVSVLDEKCYLRHFSARNAKRGREVL